MIQITRLEEDVQVRIEINVDNPTVRAALDQNGATALLRCAVATALSALAMGDNWPDRALKSLADLLQEMKCEVLSDARH